MAKTHVVVKDHHPGFFKRLKQIKDSAVKVGVLADDATGGGEHETGPDGTPSELTVAEIATVNEFGSEDGDIPARSFVRSTFDEQREGLIGFGKKLMAEVVFGDMTIDRALNLMGSKLAAEMKKKITDGEGLRPENTEATIAAKGSDRPLVDTGRLVGAITWAVEQNGKGGHGGE